MIGLGLLTQGMNMNIQNVSYRRLYNGLCVRGSCIVYTNIQPVVQLVVESKQKLHRVHTRTTGCTTGCGRFTDNSFYTKLKTFRHIFKSHKNSNKKLSYRRVTARFVVSNEILPIATQHCRNYLYDKS